MHVVDYIKANGLDKLVEEYKIVVTDYPDRVVLNYNQIESPRFNPICDECRALILRKGTWEVLARSFDRFYNIGEQGDKQKPIDIFYTDILQKLDGSLLSLYFDGLEWCVSTRKMAFAEGATNLGITFKQLFNEASYKTKLWNYLDMFRDFDSIKENTFVFELTSPANRVVTPYAETEITLIAVRNKVTGREIGTIPLNYLAETMGVKRPKIYSFKTMQEVIDGANALNSMDEGFVMVSQFNEPDGSFYRLKCKNAKYLAISHMRNNGNISPYRILKLVLEGETEEYLSYFECDTPYFDFVQGYYNEFVDRLVDLKNKYINIESQKEFALTIIPLTKYSFEKGILFECRKGNDLYNLIKTLDPKKASKAMGLKEKFQKNFNVAVTEEEEDV